MKKPVLLVIMDGVGISKTGIGDAVSAAHMPTYQRLKATCPTTTLKAHGDAVGLPSDEDMGNSEVGHNALGCGQIYSQGAKLVNESIATGKIFESETWHEIADRCRKGGTLHLLGLLSDGNVHSNINHLYALINRAKQEQVARVRIHILLDGRDVPALSSTEYTAALEDMLLSVNDASFDAKIASGGGRMNITMDRYQADWDMVKRGYDTHVHGLGRRFKSAAQAIETYRKELSCIDQDLPAFVIEDENGPLGTIEDGDCVVLFNFRGDRSIEISMAFEYDDFTHFNRGNRPNVFFAGMLSYDGDLNLPKNYLVQPPSIKNTLSELLIADNISQYAVSETQKFGHVTYFWNGNRSGKFSQALETYKEIPSDRLSFDERPWMKCAEITDDVIAALRSGKYDFVRCNFPNGDMVGHTGNYDAVIVAMSALDLALTRLEKICTELGVTLLITADHGNADEMLEKNKKGELEPRTAHSLNPVPFIICGLEDVRFAKGPFGLANVAPTIAKLFGLSAPECWESSIIE